MAVIGNTPTQQAFTPAVDYFSGTGSATAFTLSRPVASVAQVQVTIDNVAQNPSSAYTVSSNTITFTSAPLSGTNNIYVYYTSPITQVIAPGQGTVTNVALDVYGSSGTGAENLPSGTTAQRPSSPVAGATRYNSTIGAIEVYNGSQFQTLPSTNASTNYSVEYLLVAGGAGGGSKNGGGGGAGGVLSGLFTPTVGTAYTVTIGAGGAKASAGGNNYGNNGGNSSAFSQTATGGGGGSGQNASSAANSGGSGGGAGAANSSSYTTPGVGTAGQGTQGGGSFGRNTPPAANDAGGGGGGAAGPGVIGSSYAAGNGGPGIMSTISGTTAYYGGGGGGGGFNATAPGYGGIGGGGAGCVGAGGVTSPTAVSGTANTGGGGGGGNEEGQSTVMSGAGGSGVFIVKYPGAQRGSGGTVTSVAGYTIHTFNSSSTYTA